MILILNNQKIKKQKTIKKGGNQDKEEEEQKDKVKDKIEKKYK